MKLNSHQSNRPLDSCCWARNQGIASTRDLQLRIHNASYHVGTTARCPPTFLSSKGRFVCLLGHISSGGLHQNEKIIILASPFLAPLMVELSVKICSSVSQS